MTLSYDLVVLLLSKYLKEVVLPKAVNPHPIFTDLKGGIALAKRLYLCLRAKEYAYLVIGTSINIRELFRIMEEKFETNDGFTIVGLGYYFTKKDLDELKRIHQEILAYR